MDDRRLWAAWRALTQRQREVFDLLCEGSTRMEIAEILGVKVRLVDSDIATVVRALEVDDPDRPRLTSGQRRMELRRRQAHLRALQRTAAPQAGPSGSPPPAEDAEPEEAPAEPRALMRATPIIESDVDDVVSPRGWWALGAALTLLLVMGVLAIRAFHHPDAGQATAAETTIVVTPATTAPSLTDGAPVPTPALASAPTIAPATTTTTVPSTATPQPPPATVTPPEATTAVTPATGPVELAGKVASALPGTPLAVGATVTSVVDQAVKPRDVYALSLHAGQRLQVQLHVPAYGTSYTLALGTPGKLPDDFTLPLCSWASDCTRATPIATDGVYPLVIWTAETGLRYTLHTAALPFEVAPGVTNLTGKVASELPGTPLASGTAVTSVVDRDAKGRDVYALAAVAGQTLRVEVDAPSGDVMVVLLPPGTLSVAGAFSGSQGTVLCSTIPACAKAVPVAASGTYVLVIEAIGSEVQYTLRATAQ